VLYACQGLEPADDRHVWGTSVSAQDQTGLLLHEKEEQSRTTPRAEALRRLVFRRTRVKLCQDTDGPLIKSNDSFFLVPLFGKKIFLVFREVK
jgi:hypothetical protein